MRYIFFIIFITLSLRLSAQDVALLLEAVREKTKSVKDYTAQGKIKTDIAFIKAPLGTVKIYYKEPDQLKIERDKGISILPKGGVTLNLGALVATDDFILVPAGDQMIGTVSTKVVKLLPNNPESDLVLSTLYLDDARKLILKAVTTTRENGTYEMEMYYGAYEKYGLPDKVIFNFNIKDYKMPKGVTLDFEEVSEEEKARLKNGKGRVEIIYQSYTINAGIPDTVFEP